MAAVTGNVEDWCSLVHIPLEIPHDLLPDRRL
jgi:hypothetical protein